MYDKITISGKICTGKSTLFSHLQQALGWPTFSASQFFRDYAKSHGVSLQKAEEQNPTLTQDIDVGMKKRLQEPGHVMLEGWMAGIMANATPGILRILLTCDDLERIRRMAKRDGLSEEEARRKVSEREGSWTAKLETIYHRSDFFDPRNYNLVIDTTDKSPKETLDLVLQALGYYNNNSVVEKLAGSLKSSVPYVPQEKVRKIVAKALGKRYSQKLHSSGDI